MRVLIALERSDISERAGSRKTTIPAYREGSKRRGFPKSRSRVTSTLCSVRHAKIKVSSVAPHNPYSGTVTTSYPASRRSRVPWKPRFSSSLNFKPAPPQGSRRNAHEPSQLHKRCRRVCRPPPGRGTAQVIPWYSYLPRGSQG